MEISTKVNGMMTSQMGKVNFGMQMVITFLAIGLMAKLMVQVFILQLMDQLTMENGKMIYSKARVKKHGLISLILKADTSKVPSMEKESTNMLMDQFTKAIGAIIKFLEMEYTLGLTRKIMKVNG